MTMDITALFILVFLHLITTSSSTSSSLDTGSDAAAAPRINPTKDDQIVADDDQLVSSYNRNLITVHSSLIGANNDGRHLLDYTNLSLSYSNAHILVEDGSSDSENHHGGCGEIKIHFEVLTVDFHEVTVPLCIAMWIFLAAGAKMGEPFLILFEVDHNSDLLFDFKTHSC